MRQWLEVCHHSTRNGRRCQSWKREGPFSRASGRTMALLTSWFQISGLWNYERINSVFQISKTIVIYYRSPRNPIHHLNTSHRTFSVKGQIVFSVLPAIQSLFQLCNWMGVAMFQWNFIYKNQQQVTFGLWALVCRLHNTYHLNDLNHIYSVFISLLFQIYNYSLEIRNSNYLLKSYFQN